ncbi:hypothetical protein FRB95_012307 [Tulasnella sp. JGI-2019a]|nr:hypothetical protein FRB95_012307 [Tulasnella sp. JGI-2019a]
MSFSGVTISNNLDGMGDPMRINETSGSMKNRTLEIPDDHNIFIDTDMVNMDPILGKEAEGATERAAVRFVTTDFRKDESLIPAQGYRYLKRLA